MYFNKLSGGGKGIRTPAPIARPPGFQDRSLQPDLGISPLERIYYIPRYVFDYNKIFL